MAAAHIKDLLQAIARVRQRRMLVMHIRQIGWSLAVLAVLFILCVLLAMALPLQPIHVLLLFCTMAAAVAILVGWYVRAIRRFKIEDRRLAHYIDERMPGLEQRLLTSVDVWEKQDAQSRSKLVTSLWRDTLNHVNDENIQRAANWLPAGFATGTALILIVLLAGAQVATYHKARHIVAVQAVEQTVTDVQALLASGAIPAVAESVMGTPLLPINAVLLAQDEASLTAAFDSAR